MWCEKLFDKPASELEPVVEKPKRKKIAWPTFDKKNWWIWTLLAVISAIPLTLAVWMAVDPSVLDSYNKERADQKSFNSALVDRAENIWLPNKVWVKDQLVDVRGFVSHLDGSRCAFYYFSKDNVKLALERKVCVSPEKSVKAETSPWRNISEDLEKLQKAIQELGASYTGSGYGPGML